MFIANVDCPIIPQTSISFCTGMRGLERGVERALETLSRQTHGKEEQKASGYKSINIAAYVEIEAFVVWNLVEQMEQGILDPAPIWTDLKTFPSASFHGKIHSLFAGYPCQPFSKAGNRLGTEDPRHLWPYISKSIESINPLLCFFENVPDHLSMGFDEVYRSLVDMGYRVEAGLFTAAEVGAPHERERLFILAVADSYYREFHRTSGLIYRQEKQEGLQESYEDQEPSKSIGLGDTTSLRSGQREGQQISTGRDSIIAAGPELGNTTIVDEREHSGRSNKIKSGRSSSNDNELADTSIHRNKTGLSKKEKRTKGNTKVTHNNSDGIREVGDTTESGSQREKHTAKSRVTTESSGAVGNPEIERTQRERSNRQQKPEEHGGQTISLCTSRNDRWPARRGEDQYPWEPPRIESRLGFKFDGYNFREDLLRMAGNGVVEQQAEIAFINLWNKIMQ